MIKSWGKAPANLKYSGRWVDNWFSNFKLCHFTLDGYNWPSVENYYQANKTTNKEEYLLFLECTPSYAKQLGKRITLRTDWENIKYDVMLKALKAKWYQEPFKSKLLATGDEDIVEWNNWGDTIWGATLGGKGENKLGCMLMEIRKELQENKVLPH